MQSPKAYELLTWDSNLLKFVLNPEALNFMRKLASPLSIVTVAGMYRTGKSYLLNRVLLNRNRAFEVGPSINPCTRGLWLWGEALPGTLEDGSPCSVIVIDTEGIGGLEKDSNYDSRIFSIASIISSCFIYNSTGAIDENAIDSLSLIVNLSKLVQSSSSSSFYPKFVWVLRDFTLQLIDENGKAIEPNQYLEKTLMEQNGFSDSVEKKNKIRNVLKGFYQERECVPLVRPSGKESDLQKLDQLELSELRNEFVQQIMELRKKVMFKAKAKKVGGVQINGELLVRLLEDCVKAFNDGNVPNIDSTWGYICKSHNRKILDSALEVYENYFNENVSTMEESELKSLKKDSKNEAKIFLTKNLIVQDNEVFKLFKERMNEKWEEAKIQNQYLLKMHYMNFLKDQYTELDSQVKSGKFSNLVGFEKSLKVVEKEYFENCIPGQLKSEIFLTFVREISSKAGEYLVGFYANEAKMQKLANEEIREKFLNEIKELQGAKVDLEKQVASVKGDLIVSQSKESLFKEQISSFQAQKEDFERTIRDLQKHKTGELEELKIKYSTLQTTLQEVNRKHNFELSDLQDQMALLSQKLSLTESSLEEYKNKDRTYSDRIKEIRAEQTQSQKSLQLKYDQQIEKLNEKLTEKNKETNELENEIELKEALLEEVQTLLNETKSEFEGYRSKSEQEIEDLRTQLSEKEAFYSKKVEKMEQDYKVSTARIRARLSETEKKLRNSEELLRNDMAIWAQDNAILVQKIEFLEQEVEELNYKREEEKKHYTSVISSLESDIHKPE